ncbi:MAG: hypothetical protein CL528_13340 [Aequorivita sp.]|jgi:SAM-dependent methyltransferase|nr:hypothetical protein [Aequorivita sp.]|tara:strand:+ start:3231 stop:3899 length:669 start_codon:yes stop_codon:yes gene_type:complete
MSEKKSFIERYAESRKIPIEKANQKIVLLRWRKMKGLEIGAGDKKTKMKGVKFIHTDKFPQSKEVIKLDVDKKFPYPDETFDVVCAYGMLEHVEKFYFTVNEIHRVLKKGGMFLMDFPHFSSAQYYWEPDHDYRLGHSRMMHSYVEWFGDKGMRGASQNRKFTIERFDYVMTLGKITKKIIGHKRRFLFYENFFARGFSPLQIDFIYFDLRKDGFWNENKSY